MYKIKVLDEFSGAHNLRHYKGKCESLHGHNWKVEVSVYAARLDQKGMVMDFRDLKAGLRKVLAGLDHKYLNDVAYFRKKNPTSENMAEYIHAKLRVMLKTEKMKVSVWETDSSCASYSRK